MRDLCTRSLYARSAQTLGSKSGTFLPRFLEKSICKILAQDLLLRVFATSLLDCSSQLYMFKVRTAPQRERSDPRRAFRGRRSTLAPARASRPAQSAEGSLSMFNFGASPPEVRRGFAPRCSERDPASPKVCRGLTFDVTSAQTQQQERSDPPRVRTGLISALKLAVAARTMTTAGGRFVFEGVNQGDSWKQN